MKGWCGASVVVAAVLMGSSLPTSTERGEGARGLVADPAWWATTRAEETIVGVHDDVRRNQRRARGRPDLSEDALLSTPPPGPYRGPTGVDAGAASGFSPVEPIVGTYYFYWYDEPSGENVVHPDGTDRLTDHPVHLRGYSYRRPEWHRRELADILDAGIDFILPVFHGNPADRQMDGPLNWSFEGLPPLVAAAQALEAAGRTPPRIGLFYDTTTLQRNAAGHHVDLSTPDGRAWFYVTLRDFFSLIPPGLRATMAGRPLVFLYVAHFAKAGADDPRLLEYVNAHFARDFGGVTPYIVAERSWRIPADSTFAWGAALFGLEVHGVAAVGPGFDERASTDNRGRRQDREGGAFYARNWEKLLALDPAHRPKMVLVETWNEWFEATEVADSREYGRQYIELTRRFAERWRAGR